MKKIIFTLMLSSFSIANTEKKIVGLVAIKNEQNSIEQCLHALSLYTDAIVVLDDVSEDSTPTILQNNKDTYHLHIITKKIWQRDEAKDRNLMLRYGRAIGGTHFIIIDADEMFTAPCARDNYLRKKILALSPGDWLSCSWINLYEDAQKYHRTQILKPFIFCDDGIAEYDDSIRIHASRIPEKLSGTEHILKPTFAYDLLHFKYINWENVVLRNAWYQCLIAIMWPKIPRKELGIFYQQKLEQQTGNLTNVNPAWFDYHFFSLEDFAKPDHWRTQQMLEWFKEYGHEYFQDLSIPAIKPNGIA